MQELTDKLQQTPVIYVTRDIERACALENTPNYYIISNFNESFKSVDNPNTLLIKEERQLDTWELLQHPKTKDFIKNLGSANLVVFKPTKQIERICTENNWNLLNPSAELSDKIEEKISQLDWLGDLKKYLPDYSVKLCKDVEWKEEKFILQFNRSHTGSGTMLIESNEQLEEIKNKFPEREARLAKYIEGPLFTNNNIVTKSKILIGNINYQITGLRPFTDLPFATIGNDWGWPHKYLSKEQFEQYKKIVTDIGEKLHKDGWKGLFGVDIVVEESTDKLYLVEINARQPASTTYESQLQKDSLTTFEAHLAGLLDIDLTNHELTEIKDGAQIISRITSQATHIASKTIEELKKEGFILTKYDNTKQGSDLLRIQINQSIMEGHDKFNGTGKKIKQLIA
ncbi:MAG: ATP-grasp domain-containing protein [Candidatus Magasanikbacteria bacterium]|mgnify:CR=1 FL=1|jgi:predicted ATP-grasp superfamily ATP-dependent carboligase|nr:ATP-grasp domain-containing protein [Candidatus Magasanikbacteria bacterium]MBT4314746.1 ATP-grasp domain-containing protein [Candidatus Magasanikbacteria bacterium]MBT4547523.1 ATP-grasp domain-containing protein [Candidatus Magasanikbacteria bacterium]MBT6819411.1 ATP-grasp domain-containing protein [Candidatus Magasanikbacteria bacterium]